MAEFGALDLSEMQGEDQRLNTQGGGQNDFLSQFVPMPTVKPGQKGTVAVRILPPVKGGRLFQYNRVHTLNDRKIHCPRPLVNGKFDWKTKCPICEYYQSLWKQVDKLENAGQGAEAKKLKGEARSIKPVERYYYNAIVRSLTIDGETNENVGPRILSIGKKLHKSIIAAIVGEEGVPDSKLGNITDLKNGYDFIIKKEVTAGEGFPNYDGSSFARNTSPAGTPEEVQEWQENLHDLTKLRNPKDIEYLEKELAIHRGLIPDDSSGFDTEGFDAKWGAGNKGNSEEVQEIMNHTPGGVAVPAETPAPSDDVQTSDASGSSSEEDTPIEDEEFMKTLQDLDAE